MRHSSSEPSGFTVQNEVVQALLAGPVRMRKRKSTRVPLGLKVTWLSQIGLSAAGLTPAARATVAIDSTSLLSPLARSMSHMPLSSGAGSTGPEATLA